MNLDKLDAGIGWIEAHPDQHQQSYWIGAGQGSTSPPREVVLGASLGEVPHSAYYCDRGGEPHLGPCVDPGSAGAS